MKPLLLAAPLFLILFAGCKNGKHSTALKNTSTKASRLNGNWQLNFITGTATTFNELFPGKKPVVLIDVPTSHVSGKTGCNSFAGPVTISDGQLNFDKPLVITKMFCPGDGETVFLETLKKTETWLVIDGITLELLMGEAVLMRFNKIQ